MSMSSDEARAFLISLQMKGVGFITIDFDGAGDSGEISNVDFLDENNRAYHSDDITDEDYQNVEEVFYCLFDNMLGDWYNNEGGYGSVTIELDGGNYSIDANYRTVETENYEGSLADL